MVVYTIVQGFLSRIFTPSKYGLSTRLEYSGRTINNIKQERCHKLQQWFRFITLSFYISIVTLKRSSLLKIVSVIVINNKC